MVGEPCAPAPLHRHLAIDLRNHNADARGEQRKVDQRDNQDSAGIALLERIENLAIPDVHAKGSGKVEQDQDKYQSRQEPCPAFTAYLAPESERALPEAAKEQPSLDLVGILVTGIEIDDNFVEIFF